MELIFILTAEGPFIFHHKNGGTGGIFLFFLEGLGMPKSIASKGRETKDMVCKRGLLKIITFQRCNRRINNSSKFLLERLK